MILSSKIKPLSVAVALLSGTSFPASSRAELLQQNSGIFGVTSQSPYINNFGFSGKVPEIENYYRWQLEYAVQRNDIKSVEQILIEKAPQIYSQYLQSLEFQLQHSNNFQVNLSERINQSEKDRRVSKAVSEVAHALLDQLNTIIESTKKNRIIITTGNKESKSLQMTSDLREVLYNNIIEAIADDRQELLDKTLQHAYGSTNNILTDFKSSQLFPGLDADTRFSAFLFKALGSFLTIDVQQFIQIDEPEINLTSRSKTRLLKNAINEGLLRSLARSYLNHDIESTSIVPDVPNMETVETIDKVVDIAVYYALSFSDFSLVVNTQSSKLSDEIRKLNQASTSNVDPDKLDSEFEHNLYSVSKSLLNRSQDHFDRMKQESISFKGRPNGFLSKTLLQHELEQIILASEVAQRMVRHTESVQRMKSDHRLWHRLPAKRPTYKDYFTYLLGSNLTAK